MKGQTKRFFWVHMGYLNGMVRDHFLWPAPGRLPKTKPE